MKHLSNAPEICQNTEKENCLKETANRLNHLDKEVTRTPEILYSKFQSFNHFKIDEEYSFIQNEVKNKSLNLITTLLKKGFPDKIIQSILTKKAKGFIQEAKNNDGQIIESEVSEQKTKKINEKRSEKLKTNETKHENLNKKTEVTDLKKTVFANIGPQNITGLRENVLTQLKDSSIDVDTYNRAMELIDEHETKLQSLRPLFHPGDEAIFGQIIKSTKLNLSAQNPAEIYTDLFIQIDSGITNEDRKETLKSSIAEKLGFKYQGRPANANDLKLQIIQRNQAVTKNQKDESGETVQFDTNHPIVMSESPQIIIYPKGNEYICEGKIDGLGTESLKMKFSEKMSNTELNNRMNKLMLNALFSNHQNSGVINALYGTGADIGGTETNIENKTLGDSAMTEAITEMFLGKSILDGARFIRPDELTSIRDNICWLVPDGDLGVFNTIDPQSAVALMNGLGFETTDQGKANMKRAGQLFQGNTGEKSYQMLYNLMYPDDEGNDYKRLHGILGEEIFGRLEYINH